MSGPPTIADVIAWLAERGQPAMVDAVERLQLNYSNCREANNGNMRVIEELRARYEPRPFRYADYRPPSEATD